MILFVSRIDQRVRSSGDHRFHFCRGLTEDSSSVLPSLHVKYHIKRLQQKMLFTLASVVRLSELEL